MITRRTIFAFIAIYDGHAQIQVLAAQLAISIQCVLHFVYLPYIYGQFSSRPVAYWPFRPFEFLPCSLIRRPAQPLFWGFESHHPDPSARQLFYLLPCSLYAEAARSFSVLVPGIEVSPSVPFCYILFATLLLNARLPLWSLNPCVLLSVSARDKSSNCRLRTVPCQ